MKTTLGTESAKDEQLVEWSLTGDREAFGRIVQRYQSLVCSISYGATGSLGLSEDIAQETFLTAWRKLDTLSDTAKLRAWLCGIARNLVNNSLRRGQREPVQAAEPLDAIHELTSPEPSPSAQAVSHEEEAILWRALERIPDTYREPLILFYREQQSVERVAEKLELSEDAVKQRLSRGRKLLTEEVAALVEGTLKRTTPGKAFTLGVLAALPVLTTSAKAAVVGAAATKGSATAKAAGLGGFLQMILAALPIASLGTFVGYKMSRDAGQSPQQRESVVRFWRIVVVSLAVFIVLPLVLLVSLRGVLTRDMRPQILAGLTLWLGIMYAVVAAAVGIWAWQRPRKVHSQGTGVEGVAGTRKKPFTVWVLVATIGAGILLVALLFDTNWKVGRLSTAEAQRIVAEQKDTKFAVMQYQNGSRVLRITLRENGKLSKFTAPPDESTLSLLAEKGIACPTYVQGRDFEIFGWPGRLLPFLLLFILAAGAVILLMRPGKHGFYQQEMDARQTLKMAFAVCVALAMIAMGILLVAVTRWNVHTISGAEVQKIIADYKDARFEVFQFKNGSKELWISKNRHPDFIAPADESTLSLLAEKRIACPTYVQGRDFGFDSPSRWVSLLCIFILTAGAVVLLRWAWKNQSAPLTPARV